jgi:hypothetical protein
MFPTKIKSSSLNINRIFYVLYKNVIFIDLNKNEQTK